MFKTIFASAWILAVVTALAMGLNGSIHPNSMVIFSLVGLGLIYGFALWPVTRSMHGSGPSLEQ